MNNQDNNQQGNNQQAAKTDVSLVQNQTRTDISGTINFSDILGFIETLSAAPTTQVPTNVYDQVKYYNNQLYFYDTAAATWVTVGGAMTGEIRLWSAAVVPPGWYACTGGTISRTTFAALFAVIGTTFGAGDGSTTFSVPDFSGRVPVGTGANGVTNIGDTGGEVTHTLSIAEMPTHNHPMGPFYTTSGSSLGVSGAGLAPNIYPYTGNEGGGGAHNNMQPYIGVIYIIKT